MAQDPQAGLPAGNAATSMSGSGNAPRSRDPRPSDTAESRDRDVGPAIFTFALKHRPRATRASVPKVRTGCKTCKKRHVKCDEAKPSCQRCVKWKGFCEGYDVSVEEAESSTSARLRGTAAHQAHHTHHAHHTHRAQQTLSLRTPGAAASVSNVRCVPAGLSGTAAGPPAVATSGMTPGTAPMPAYSTPISVATPAHSMASRKIESEIKPEPDLADFDLRAVDLVYVGDEDGYAMQPYASPHSTNYSSHHLQTPSSGGIIVPSFKREHEHTYDDAGRANLHGGVPNIDFSPLNFPMYPRNTPVFPLEPNYNSVMFATESEKAYFDSWLTIAPNLGGGWFPSHLWTSTIPKLCRDEPAVRFAAIAVGAMAQAMSPALLGKSSYHLLDSADADAASTSPSSASSDSDAAVRVRHYRNALTYIGHAMRLTYLGSPHDSPPNPDTATVPGYGYYTPEKERAAVMCCLLFVCFEALQGNRENAIRHITSGLQIVDQFVARNSLQPRRLPLRTATTTTATTNPGAADTEPQGQSQSASTTDTGTQGRPGRASGSEQRPVELDAFAPLLTSSPAPYILEDEVMQVFRRLDFQAWSLGVFHRRRTRPADIQFQALDALSPDTIPARFDTLDDARRWWDIVQHWVLQFPRYMVAELTRYIETNPETAREAEAQGRMLDICDVPGAHDMQKEYLLCLRRWYSAFEPLYNATRQHGDASNSETEVAFLRAASLKVQYLLAEIGIRSLVYSDYKMMYTMTPQFRELNRLAALILPKQPRYTWSPFGGSKSISSSGGGGNSNGNSNSSSSAVVDRGGEARSFGGDLFTMDNGPTMAIFVVSCKCRCEAVRDESTRLLAAYPRRDGFWDSKVLSSIAKWNHVIEAENVEGTLDEQWHRLRQREGVFDETRPQVRMSAWVKNKEKGCFEFETHIVKWDTR